MDIVSIVTKAGIGAAAGISYAFTGFAKNKGESMDWVKFSKTVILGAGIGVASEFAPISMQEAQIYAGTLGFTALIENGLKAIFRRLR